MAMRFKDPVSLLKLKFIREQMQEIKTEHVKHAPATGYVVVVADKDFTPVELPRFVQREFDKQKYAPVNETKVHTEADLTDTNWMYYEVYWNHDRTTWRLKEKL